MWVKNKNDSKSSLRQSVAYFTKEVNPSLAKPTLNGGLAKLGLT